MRSNHSGKQEKAKFKPAVRKRKINLIYTGRYPKGSVRGDREDTPHLEWEIGWLEGRLSESWVGKSFNPLFHIGIIPEDISWRERESKKESLYLGKWLAHLRAWELSSKNSWGLEARDHTHVEWWVLKPHRGWQLYLYLPGKKVEGFLWEIWWAQEKETLETPTLEIPYKQPSEVTLQWFSDLIGVANMAE